jgi:hypothetical protein
MCNDFSININNSNYNVDIGNELDYTISIDEVPDIVINLNEQGPAGMQGEKGDQGIQGPQGVGVDRVEPILQQGYEITYRMYFTDGRYYDYVVSNGTGSLKWIHIEESDWTLVGDRYRYTYYGSYGIIELFEGTISSKSKIEFDSTIEGNTTYLYAMQPFEGYALIAGIENGEAGVYIYEQAIPSDTWVVNHNLNTYPSITIVDSGGNTVVGSENYIDKNTVEIKFSAAFTGKAYLNYTR